MTTLLAIDPGGNTGIALGYYDPITPYRLLERWQVHDGLDGFLEWCDEFDWDSLDEMVAEKFILASDNEFTADLTPVEIEGAIAARRHSEVGPYSDTPLTWQTRQDKGSLIGYPPGVDSKDQRQRARFDFLDRFGMFMAGTENDDSNDAATHALVYLKRRKHYPTQMAFWPPPHLRKA